MLDHERLEVYQVARQLSREICRVVKKTRPGRPDLINQLLRATASVPLNIAEGSGERLPGRRAYFYRIARSSATEIGSALHHMIDMEVLRDNQSNAANEFVIRIVSMLVRMTDHVSTKDSYPPLRRGRSRKR